MNRGLSGDGHHPCGMERRQSNLVSSNARPWRLYLFRGRIRKRNTGVNGKKCRLLAYSVASTTGFSHWWARKWKRLGNETASFGPHTRDSSRLDLNRISIRPLYPSAAARASSVQSAFCVLIRIFSTWEAFLFGIVVWFRKPCAFDIKQISNRGVQSQLEKLHFPGIFWCNKFRGLVNLDR